ncbi:MAG: methylenetetrahydrofolate reductase [NAD(P)H] [Planctomycetes bacterium]|nr:methylenetetrahydrofolate reductase [NAD(P)H] [Planctomycetota bacterium]
MHVRDILKRDKTIFSFEFFPPNTEKGWNALTNRLSEFEELEPSYVSVTYGAGGTTRTKTRDLVCQIASNTELDPIPHLTCVGHKKDEIHSILQEYADAGIDNLLALRGDIPTHGCSDGDYSYAADLIDAIHGFEGASFGVGIAGFPEGHPETPNRLVQLDHLKSKVDRGVDWMCTQLFFDNNAFFDWCQQCELVGIDTPIIAGIMPITTIAGMRRMAELAGGANFPAPLQQRLYRFQDDPESVRRVGVNWAAQQCAQLLDHGVRGIHFFTMNQSSATEEIYKALGAPSGSKLRGLHE